MWAINCPGYVDGLAGGVHHKLLILSIPDFKLLGTLFLHIVICDLDYAYKKSSLNL